MKQRTISRLLLGAFSIFVVVLFIIFAILGTQFFNTVQQNTPPGKNNKAQTTVTATSTPIPTSTPLPTPSPTATPIPTLREVVQAQAYYLLDLDTGAVLANSNETLQLPMGRTTKMMTAILALENTDPDLFVTIPQEAVERANLYGQDGASHAQLKAGDILRMRDVLYGLLLPSGADASIAIAHAVAGSTERFIQMMNEKAQNLQLTQTHFSSTDGLTEDDGQNYTTAVDLARLSQYAMNTFPLFAQIVQTAEYHVPPTFQHLKYDWYTTNDILKEGLYPGMIGVKTGWTSVAQYCFVFAAAPEGTRRLLGVTLGSPSRVQRDKDAMAILDEGFTQ